MPTTKKTNHRSDRLEEAVATLIQNQAAFHSNMRVQAEIREIRRHNDRQFAEIIAALNRHEQTLRHLPEAVRGKARVSEETIKLTLNKTLFMLLSSSCSL